MTTTHSSNDEEQLKQLIENWTEAVCKEDMNGVLANHADDILMYDVPAPFQSKGIEAYRKTWELYFSWSQKTGVFDLSEIEITTGEDVTFCTGIIHCAGKDKHDVKQEI